MVCTSVKDSCIIREQYIHVHVGIHDVVSDRGFVKHYKGISNTLRHVKVFQANYNKVSMKCILCLIGRNSVLYQ